MADTPPRARGAARHVAHAMAAAHTPAREGTPWEESGDGPSSAEARGRLWMFTHPYPVAKGYETATKPSTIGREGLVKLLKELLPQSMEYTQVIAVMEPHKRRCMATPGSPRLLQVHVLVKVSPQSPVFAHKAIAKRLARQHDVYGWSNCDGVRDLVRGITPMTIDDYFAIERRTVHCRVQGPLF